MMYFFILLIVASVLIYLTTIGELRSEKAQKLRILNLTIGIIGLVILIASLVCGVISINISGLGEEWISWAKDMYLFYFGISLPFLFVFISAISAASAAAFFDKKVQGGYPHKVRIITSVASSAVLLIIALFYSDMIKNKNLSLDIFVLAAGLGEALAMRLTFALEYTLQIRLSMKKK